MARFLVLGGGGFIGVHLSAALASEGHDVVVVDKRKAPVAGLNQLVDHSVPRVEYTQANLSSPSAIELVQERWDGIFNLAGATGHLASMNDPQSDLEDNVLEQLAYLRALASSPQPADRVIFASTRQVYGRGGPSPATELSVPDPPDLNGCHKLLAENYHTTFSRSLGTSSVIARLPNVYGPHLALEGPGAGVIGTWFRRAIHGLPIEVFGEGTDRRDFLYVSDCVEALVKMMEAPEAGSATYNVGGPDPASLWELAEQIGHLSGSPVVRVPRPKSQGAIDIGDSVVDDRRIREQLGWRPRIALSEGLSLTWASLTVDR